MSQPKQNTARVVVLVLCIALVLVAAATVTLLIMRSKGPGNGEVTTSTTSSTPSPATPSPSSGGPTFLDGMRQIPSLPNWSGVFGGTDAMAILFAMGDFAHPVAVDRTSGATVWEGGDGDCTDVIAGTALVCTVIADWQGTVTGMNWLDVKTGQSEGSLDLTSIGARIYALTATSQGVLVIGGNIDQSNNPPDVWSAIIGYFTGPGAPAWTASVQMYAPVDEEPIEQPFDEAEGLFAWHTNANTYVLDAQTGFVVYQANSYTPAQIFSNRLVCMGYFDTPSQPNNLQVNVPGGSPATVTTCAGQDTGMMILGPGHPNMLLRTSGGSITGCTLEAVNPADPWMSSPIWSTQEAGADCAESVAWDGQSTAYAASGTGIVWAFDINTGQVLWHSSYDTDGTDGYWNPHVFTSDGLVAIDLYSQGVLGFPAWTVLRADNGQPMPGLGGDFGFLQDGVLMTFKQDTSTWDVFVPSFG